MAYSETRAKQVLASLETLGTCKTKKMFGALAIYLDDVLFAAVMEDNFCLRGKSTDLEAEFLARGFTRHKVPGRKINMPYFDVPDELVDNTEELIELCRDIIVTNMKIETVHTKKTNKV